jgi:hypothetical protein
MELANIVIVVHKNIVKFGLFESREIFTEANKSEYLKNISSLGVEFKVDRVILCFVY